MAWKHSEVYNAIITRSLHRLAMAPAVKAWHVIWLWHEGMIALKSDGEPVPIRDASFGDEVSRHAKVAPRRFIA